MSRAAPDGYTLAVTGVSSMSAGPHLRGDKLPFDPMAFAHITRLVRMPLILAVRNDLPAQDPAGVHGAGAEDRDPLGLGRHRHQPASGAANCSRRCPA